jgi:hypothetical protein
MFVKISYSMSFGKGGRCPLVVDSWHILNAGPSPSASRGKPHFRGDLSLHMKREDLFVHWLRRGHKATRRQSVNICRSSLQKLQAPTDNWKKFVFDYL